jgi:hypothetical protein
MGNILIDFNLVKDETGRQKNRQIARLFDDIKGFPMPPLVQKRIKEALYEMENGIITYIQDNGIYDKSKQN